MRVKITVRGGMLRIRAIAQQGKPRLHVKMWRIHGLFAKKHGKTRASGTHTAPVSVPGVSGVTAISGSYAATCVLLSDVINPWECSSLADIQPPAVVVVPASPKACTVLVMPTVTDFVCRGADPPC